MPSTRLASSFSLDNEEVVEDVEGPQGDNIDYSSMTVTQLKVIAKERNIEGYSNLKKAELIERLL
ncbi:Rho termination factor N-terminal domain-containing protein [Terrisporobacter petrolearius]|uniref:Rho termination factor N-terminal domain-containing protein n=1 Tax=Terrisporobacter petrolearius TaxID=1460447 RepID=UPI0031CC6681